MRRRSFLCRKNFQYGNYVNINETAYSDIGKKIAPFVNIEQDAFDDTNGLPNVN